MMTKSKMISSGSFAPARQPSPLKRGELGYPITAADLIEFGRSPLRWLRTPPPEPNLPPSLLDVIRCTLLANGELKSTFISRPATYPSTMRVCPNCKSEGTAKVCRTCNLTRVVLPCEKKWSANADYCVKWAEKKNQTGVGIVTPDRWETAEAISRELILDPDCSQLINGAGTLGLIHGTWEHPGTGVTIPLQETIDLVPADETNLETALASICVVSDSSPAAFALRTYATGAHVRAALQRRLFNDCSPTPRDYHLWLVAERNAPHLVGRRSASTELMTLGDTILEALLNSYANCIHSGVWPAFDRSAPLTLEGFTPVFLEPWMTQGSSPAASYFAIGAVPEAA